MTTQEVEEALLELDQVVKNYHNADTFDMRLYWLKQVGEKAVSVKIMVDETT